VEVSNAEELKERKKKKKSKKAHSSSTIIVPDDSTSGKQTDPPQGASMKQQKIHLKKSFLGPTMKVPIRVYSHIPTRYFSKLSFVLNDIFI
jgi:hypothetical protein